MDQENLEGLMEVNKAESRTADRLLNAMDEVLRIRLGHDEQRLGPSRHVGPGVDMLPNEDTVQALNGLEYVLCGSGAGVKHDNGKLRWTLLPWESLQEVVKVLEFGAKKYAEDNWKKVPGAKKRYTDAMIRHWVEWHVFGRKVDDESNLHPLAHMVCDALFCLYFEMEDAKVKEKSNESH